MPKKATVGVLCDIWLLLKKGETSYGAYDPDLPGCVAVAETESEVMSLIHEAMEFHLVGLREDNEPIPFPHSEVKYVEVRAA